MGWRAAGGGGETPREIWGIMAHLLLSPQVTTISQPWRAPECVTVGAHVCRVFIWLYLCMCVSL